MAVKSLSEKDWDRLIRLIDQGMVTPFLGAGASAERVQTAAQMAECLAGDFHYPLPDRSSLAHVSQFVAVTEDEYTAKSAVARLCEPVSDSASNQSDIHATLAKLPFSVYLTTNYDNLMVQALSDNRLKPRRELCAWTKWVQTFEQSVFKREPTYEPDPSNPLVYHLHGVRDVPQSMVVTEDDYLDFLIWFGREWANQTNENKDVLPRPVIKALAGTALLFIGYSRADWNFRFLFRGLVASLAAKSSMKSVAVQLSPLPSEAPASDKELAEAYLEKYFHSIDKIPVNIFWGTASEFASQLIARWSNFKDGM